MTQVTVNELVERLKGANLSSAPQLSKSSSTQPVKRKGYFRKFTQAERKAWAIAKGHIMPSTFKIIRLEAKKKELQDDIRTWYPRFSKKEAEEIVESDEVYTELLKFEDKHLRLKMIKELIPKIFKGTEDRLEKGDLEPAARGMTALGIGMDKAWEKDRQKPTLNIGGKNVQINVGFPFKPQRTANKKPLDNIQ